MQRVDIDSSSATTSTATHALAHGISFSRVMDASGENATDVWEWDNASDYQREMQMQHNLATAHSHAHDDDDADGLVNFPSRSIARRELIMMATDADHVAVVHPIPQYVHRSQPQTEIDFSTASLSLIETTKHDTSTSSLLGDDTIWDDESIVPSPSLVLSYYAQAQAAAQPLQHGNNEQIIEQQNESTTSDNNLNLNTKLSLQAGIEYEEQSPIDIDTLKDAFMARLQEQEKSNQDQNHHSQDDILGHGNGTEKIQLEEESSCSLSRALAAQAREYDRLLQLHCTRGSKAPTSLQATANTNCSTPLDKSHHSQVAPSLSVSEESDDTRKTALDEQVAEYDRLHALHMQKQQKEVPFPTEWAGENQVQNISLPRAA